MVFVLHFKLPGSRLWLQRFLLLILSDSFSCGFLTDEEEPAGLQRRVEHSLQTGISSNATWFCACLWTNPKKGDIWKSWLSGLTGLGDVSRHLWAVSRDADIEISPLKRSKRKWMEGVVLVNREMNPLYIQICLSRSSLLPTSALS